MKRVEVVADAPDPEVLAEAAEVLRSGGLVAFPTETVYGLGAHALDAAAVQRIFAAKERPAFNPLIVHVHSVAAARALTTEWTQAAQQLADRFWPGPLTLVLPKRLVVPDVVTAGLPSVGIRIPSHPVALALLRLARLPIAAPSANRYTELSPTLADHVAKGLGDRIDMLVDGGPTQVGIESTVLDLTGGQPRLLRPGAIDGDALERVVGPVPRWAPGPERHEARPSPGLVGRHYAPRARVFLFEPEQRSEAAELARRTRDRGGRVGALLLAPLDAPLDYPVAMAPNAEEYASRLYACLHQLDDRHCDLVLIEQVPATGAWAAVHDRIRRAADPG
jgi:L-threonylcarbamoyladenylate synthase